MDKPITRSFDEYIIESYKHKKRTVSRDDLEKYLDGHCDKTFVLCQSEFFREFFDEIQNNPKASYETYLNDFIKKNYDGKNLPIGEVSSFQKDSEAPLLEEIMCKLANALHLPTAYVKSVVVSDEEADELFEKHIPIPKDYILSIDFISKNEFFDSMNTYDISSPRGIGLNRNCCPTQSPLREWYKCFLVHYLENPITGEKLTSDQNMELFKQFIPQYFFRTYVARDWDFKSENVGIIYNEETKIYRISPLFDFEFSYYLSDDQIDEEKLENDLDLSYSLFEKETEAFVQEILHLDVDTFVDENIPVEIVADIDDDTPTTKEFIRNSLNQLQSLVFGYVFSMKISRQDDRQA